MDHIRRGKAAADAKQYDEAIKHYDAAIAQNSNAVDYYISRSEAHHRKNPPNREQALADAEQAVALAYKRQRRENIMDAQQRRFVCLYGSERYGDADHVFKIVNKMHEKDMVGGSDQAKKRAGVLGTWGMKISRKLKELQEKLEKEAGSLSEEEKSKLQASVFVTVQDVPDAKPSPEQTKSASQAAPPSTTSSTPPGLVEQVKKIKFRDGKLTRDNWFENGNVVTITLPLKGLDKSQTQIEIAPASVSITFPLSPGTDHSIEFYPLYGKITPENSSHKITPNKLEITLRKAPGHDKKWAELEGDQDPTHDPSKDGFEADNKQKDREFMKSIAHSYPTSSRHGAKDWDNIVKEATRKPVKKRTECTDPRDLHPEKEEFDDLEVEDGGDDVNYFFKKLYAGADDDTRRAMMKSYQESNGTALSTNWSEVKKGPVETSPPDGMEAKKWGQ